MKEMKKFLLMLFVVVLPLGMVACSDDDDDDDNDDNNTEVVLAKEAAGTYTGTFDAGIADGDMTITISAVSGSDDEVNITIGDMTIMFVITASFDDIENVKLTGTEDNITIASQTKEVGMNISVLPDPFDAEVTLSGSIKDGKLELNAKVSADMLDTAQIGTLDISIEAEKE
ncbi:MAG: calycin-like domain-containing protein [Alistipes sp.]|nr:calycin-like domain-containing protein [Alistipes sp.]